MKNVDVFFSFFFLQAPKPKLLARVDPTSATASSTTTTSRSTSSRPRGGGGGPGGRDQDLLLRGEVVGDVDVGSHKALLERRPGPDRRAGAHGAVLERRALADDDAVAEHAPDDFRRAGHPAPGSQARALDGAPVSDGRPGADEAPGRDGGLRGQRRRRVDGRHGLVREEGVAGEGEGVGGRGREGKRGELR